MAYCRTALFVMVLAFGSGCGDESGDSNSNSGGSAGMNSGGSAQQGGSAGSGGGVSSGGSSSGSGGKSSGSGGSSAGSGGTDGAGGTSQAGSGGAGGDGPGMTFFVTSVGSGQAGGALGGLGGADEFCQTLSEAVGADNHTWYAYLSSSSENARDRIGAGPWYNVNGDLIAESVESLHANGLMRDPVQLVLDENGDPAPSSEHDILTGSLEDGTVAEGATCNDWTSNSADDDAEVGHADIPDAQFSPSWNSAHTANCSPAGLAQVGGAGRLYCFAPD